MSSITAALLGYSHVFVVLSTLILFVIIGAMVTVRASAETMVSGQVTERTLSPQVLFVIAQLALWAGIVLVLYFGGVAKIGLVIENNRYVNPGVVKAVLSQGWIDDTFVGSYLSAMVLVLASLSLFYVRERLATMTHIAEYYILLFCALLGIMLMCYSVHLLLIYVGLELMSLSLYAMLALERNSKTTIEAAMKYFVLGALSSGLLLFGMSLLYGATGTLQVTEYNQLIVDGIANRPLMHLATLFVIAALAFKFGLVPFHQWVPDIYQGAAYPVAMMVANITKLGVFAITMRLIITTLFSMAESWKNMLLIISLASVVVGYLGAIVQTSFRRFLGYSSIANIGFMMLAMFAAVEVRGGHIHSANVFNAISADLFYLVVYQFTSVAAFAFAWVLAKEGQEADHIDDLKGLAKRYPFFAFMFATLMLSMAGVPPFLGFTAKYLVINALLTAEHFALTVFAVLTTLIGAYYYLRMIKLMYFDAPHSDHENLITLSIPFRFVLGMHCLILIGTGLQPGWLIRLCYVIMS